MKTLLQLSALFTILGLNSCIVYAPNGVNTPLFSKKGQTAINANVDVGEWTNLRAAYAGTNLQAAYALSDNMGIMANGFWGKHEYSSGFGGGGHTIYKGKGGLFEAGIGYFTQSTGGFAFETYAGVGVGNVHIERISNVTQKFETWGTKLFVQPSVGYVRKHFEVAFTPRLSVLNYNKPTTTYSDSDLAQSKFVNINHTTWLFLEPTLTIRAGGQRLKGQIQLGGALKLNSKDLGHSANILTFGITAKLRN